MTELFGGFPQIFLVHVGILPWNSLWLLSCVNSVMLLLNMVDATQLRKCHRIDKNQFESLVRILFPELLANYIINITYLSHNITNAGVSQFCMHFHPYGEKQFLCVLSCQDKCSHKCNTEDYRMSIFGFIWNIYMWKTEYVQSSVGVGYKQYYAASLFHLLKSYYSTLVETFFKGYFIILSVSRLYSIWW
jgi:hypothetical protein